MCFAIPGKIIDIDREAMTAIVDYDVERREVSIAMLPEINEGEYVLVQAKMAVQKVDEEQAREFVDSVSKVFK